MKPYYLCWTVTKLSFQKRPQTQQKYEETCKELSKNFVYHKCSKTLKWNDTRKFTYRKLTAWDLQGTTRNFFRRTSKELRIEPSNDTVDLKWCKERAKQWGLIKTMANSCISLVVIVRKGNREISWSKKDIDDTRKRRSTKTQEMAEHIKSRRFPVCPPERLNT